MTRHTIAIWTGGLILAGLIAAISAWKQTARTQVSGPDADSPADATTAAAPRAARQPAAAFPTPHRPVPPLTQRPHRYPVIQPPAPEQDGSDGLIKATRLPVERLHDYLLNEGRTAASLLAAARISGDPDLLKEAFEAFPNNPQVLLDWLMRGATLDKSRMEALLAFRKADPQNALGDYLIALEQFRNGSIDSAVTTLSEGWKKTVAESNVLLHAQAMESAYQAAGYSQAEAAATAYYGVTLETIAPLRELADWIRAVVNVYTAAGDTESARLVSLMGARLGSQMQQQTGQLLIMEELTAMNIEGRFLSTLDPASELVAGGQTVSERLLELEARKEEIKAVIPAIQNLSGLNDEAKLRYFEDLAAYGEVEALKRLQERP